MKNQGSLALVLTAIAVSVFYGSGNQAWAAKNSVTCPGGKAPPCQHHSASALSAQTRGANSVTPLCDPGTTQVDDPNDKDYCFPNQVPYKPCPSGTKADGSQCVTNTSPPATLKYSCSDASLTPDSKNNCVTSKNVGTAKCPGGADPGEDGQCSKIVHHGFTASCPKATVIAHLDSGDVSKDVELTKDFNGKCRIGQLVVSDAEISCKVGTKTQTGSAISCNETVGAGKPSNCSGGKADADGNCIVTTSVAANKSYVCDNGATANNYHRCPASSGTPRECQLPTGYFDPPNGQRYQPNGSTCALR